MPQIHARHASLTIFLEVLDPMSWLLVTRPSQPGAHTDIATLLLITPF